MGAYAALNFARPLRADRVLSMMPQYSIDPKKVPFETRWRAEAAQTRFIFDFMDQPLKPDAKAYIVYDPLHKLDRAHAKAIARSSNCYLVPMPLIDHNWIDPALLKQMVDRIVSEADDDLPTTVAKAYQIKKRSYSFYYFELSKYQRLNLEARINILLKSIALNPRHSLPHDMV
jgi:hypothetical protein